MVDTVVLDNNVRYKVVDTIEIDGVSYTLFINVNDETDFCFRKTIEKNGEKYFSGLSDRKEFEKVLLLFAEKLNR